MTITKAQIVESVENQTGIPMNKSSEIAETLLESLKTYSHPAKML